MRIARSSAFGLNLGPVGVSLSASQIAQSVLGYLPPSSVNPTAAQIASALQSAVPSWPSQGVNPTLVQIQAAAAAGSNMPPQAESIAAGIAASLAPILVALNPTPANVMASAAAQVIAGVDAGADTGTPNMATTDFVAASYDANGNPINAEGQLIPGGKQYPQFANMTAAQAAALMAPAPSSQMMIATASSPTDYSWLAWVGGGIAVLGAGWLLLRKKATP